MLMNGSNLAVHHGCFLRTAVSYQEMEINVISFYYLHKTQEINRLSLSLTSAQYTSGISGRMSMLPKYEM